MSLEQLGDLIAAHATGRGVPTGIPRLVLAREDRQLHGIDLTYRPLLCFVAQGAKISAAGTQVARVPEGHMFLNLLDLPVTAAYEPPFRSITLDIDADTLARMMAETGAHVPSSSPPLGGFSTAEMDSGLVLALTRWLSLLDEPHHIDVLAPRLEHEILYRVLVGPLGAALRRFVDSGPLADIRAAAKRLTQHVAEPVAVDDLARSAGVSPATFYRHFRQATGMSPVQFQKVSRLHRARVLLTAGTLSATQVASAVGYVSPTQFSRDYRQQYGLPPSADGRRMRGLTR